MFTHYTPVALPAPAADTAGARTRAELVELYGYGPETDLLPNNH